jgi:hypothetical protein
VDPWIHATDLWIGILLFLSVADKMPTKNKIFAYTSVFKDKNSKRSHKILKSRFFLLFCLLMFPWYGMLVSMSCLFYGREEAHPSGGGGGGGGVWGKERKYIGRDPRFFVLVLLFSITPLSSTCKSRPERKKTKREVKKVLQ